jgi:hypothetical protein
MRAEKWIYTLPVRLRSLFRRREVDQELDEEFRYHLERKTAENIVEGMTPEEAKRTAVLGIGGIEKREEESREARRVTWLQDLLQDFRFGLRMLRKAPGFTTVDALTLTLGIGVNTAIFSMADALVLRPMPVYPPNKIASLTSHDKPEGHSNRFSYPDFEDIHGETAA